VWFFDEPVVATETGNMDSKMKKSVRLAGINSVDFAIFIDIMVSVG